MGKPCVEDPDVVVQTLVLCMHSHPSVYDIPLISDSKHGNADRIAYSHGSVPGMVLVS